MASEDVAFPIANYIYLYHLDEWLLLPEYPDSIQDKLVSTFASTNALSRTAPVFTYSNSGPRNVQIQLSLHRDMIEELNFNAGKMELEEGEEFVDALVRKIQAAALPVYSAAQKMVTPPMVAVKMGEDVFIKGIIQGGVSIEYIKPILDNGKYAQVTISFDVYEVDPYDAVSVQKDGSLRGITRTFREGIYGE